MNMQKAATALVLVLFATAGIQTVGFAKAKDKDKDSVRSWGPWATLVQPAAGGPQVPNIPLAGLGQPFVELLPDAPVPPVPPVTPVDDCTAGAACGYAVIEQTRIQITAGQNPRRTINGPQLATPNLAPIPEFVFQGDGPLALNIEAPSLPITLTVASNSTPISLNLINQDVFVSPIIPGVTFWGNEDEGLEIFGISVDVLGKLVAGGFVYREVDASVDFPDVADRTITDTAFIYGVTSSIDDLAIAEMNAGNVEATYEGFALLAGTFAEINVNFGNDTWSGSFNDGSDGMVTEQPNSDGSTSLIGQVGFDASGVIDGGNIISNQISADDALAISGTVRGSFFGGEAAVLAGSIDIDKTTEEVSGNYSDIFVTVDTSNESILNEPN